MHDYGLGPRIVVRGVTGSGKSTFICALGAALGLKAIELDEIHWQRPNWEPLPLEEFKQQIEDALDSAPEGWVVDGSYTAASAIIREQMDTFIWLHLPWRVSFYRMVKRTLRRAHTKELLWGTQRESLKAQLFSKNSLWWWGIHHHRESVRRTRETIERMPHVRAYELRSAAEVAEFLEEARRVARQRSSFSTLP